METKHKSKEAIDIINEPSTSNTQKHFARSCSGRTETNTCFLCDKISSRKHQSCTISNSNAGGKLNEAIKHS